MKRYFCFFLITVCTVWSAAAQSHTLKGKVSDENGDPLPGVIVTLRNAENRIVKYSSSNSKGEFEIKTAVLEDLHLHFAMMGYAAQTVPAAGSPEGFSIKMVPETTNIREVQVKAPDIMLKGDTLVYDVSKYASESDRAIGDVLKKLPGVEVKESGQIEYQGKPINKLYIEGNDLVGGRHGLATQNISAKDVKSVEVMENHQPIKALKDIDFSENAAINLKLQEDAKGRWVGTAGLGAGFEPLLAHGALFGMRIGKGWQGMQNLKANNTGINLGRELTDFSSAGSFIRGMGSSDLRDYINIGAGSAPLADKRTRFNHSVLATSNNSYKVSDDYKFDLRINYLADRLSADNFTRTTYYFEDGSELSIDDGRDMTSRTHNLYGQANIEANTEKMFLTNRLNADFNWKETDMAVTGSFPNSQSADLPSTKLSNNFQLVKRYGQKTFTVTSLNQYTSKPHDLSVERDGLQQFQSTDARLFHSNTSVSYGWQWKRWQLSARAGFAANMRWLESSLTGIDAGDYPLENNSLTSYMRTYILPSLTYRTGRFRATLDVPFNYYHYKFDDRLTGDTSRKDQFISSPSLYANYNLSSKWSMNASAAMGKSPADESNFYTGLIMSNYRSLNMGLVDYRNGRSKSVSGGFQYKNPINSLFFNAAVAKTWATSVYTAGQIFLNGGDYIVNTLLPQENDYDSWNVRGSVSKGIDRMKGLVAVDVNYGKSESSIIRNDVRTPMSSRNITVSPRINGRLFKWCNAEYRLAYNRYWMSVPGSEDSATDNYNQSLTLNFYPARKFNFSVTGEHYFARISSTQSKHTVFVDVSAVWRLKDNWELSLSATNLLDKREYAYVMLSDLSSTSASYSIRPRNVLLSMYFRF